MEKFETLSAITCPLGLENVDTDQLIPARFMSRSRAQGYGGYLLHDLRFDSNSSALGHVLDSPRYAGARILVARRNFGTGSSREAAVYALADFGIRCVIAPSFGDIFASNATKNGVLVAVAAPEDIEAMLEALDKSGVPSLTVDLPSQTIRFGNAGWPFAIESVRKLQLINGWDDLDITRQYNAAISHYYEARALHSPWMLPSADPV